MARVPRSARIGPSQVRDRVTGALLGLAVGDALGLPAQFLTPAEIRRRLGPRGITDFVGSDYHPAGSVSDDTHTALAVAAAITESGDLGVDAVGLATAAHLVRWSKTADMDRAPDATVMRGIHRLSEGIPWRGSGDPGSKSAGALARGVPVGLAFAGRHAMIVDMAQAVCFSTHAHPLAVASVVATALLVSFAVEARPERTWSPLLRKILGGLSPEMVERVAGALARRRQSPARVMAGIGEGWSADDALARATFAALHHQNDFRAAVLLSANASGDTAATSAVTGALVGAMRGASAIPKGWRSSVEQSQSVQEAADALARIAWPGLRDQAAIAPRGRLQAE